MAKPRIPATKDAAAKLLERFSELDAAIALSNQVRDAEIGEANRKADAENAPLIAERDALLTALEAWWGKSGEKVTGGARKSVELGGCMIGTRTGKPSLGVAGKVDELVGALKATRWGKRLVQVRESLDKRAIAKELDGAHGAKLKALGFAHVDGEETFYVQRTTQEGAGS